MCEKNTEISFSNVEVLECVVGFMDNLAYYSTICKNKNILQISFHY